MTVQTAYGTVTRVQIEPEWCDACGIPYGLPEGFIAQRRKDHATWYCPNGHQWHYPEGKSDEQKLREASARETALQDQLSAAIRDAETSRAELMRVRSRIANGVCPCCNRTFDNVRAHMQTKHPDFTVDLPTGKGIVYRCSCGHTAKTYKGLRIHQGLTRGDEWDQPDTRRWSSHLTVVS